MAELLLYRNVNRTHIFSLLGYHHKKTLDNMSKGKNRPHISHLPSVQKYCRSRNKYPHRIEKINSPRDIHRKITKG